MKKIEEEMLSADLLRGAVEIAVFLFTDPKKRRRVYHLASQSRLPVFKLGSLWCARKSVLLKWIEDQEARRCAQASKGYDAMSGPVSLA